MKNEIKIHTIEDGYKIVNYFDIAKYILHCDDGPAYISLHDNNMPFNNIYFIHGKKHKEDGPALRVWDDKNYLKEERWYINDKLHNFNGPAVIRYFDAEIQNEYFIYNIKYSEFEFKKYIFQKKLDLL